MAARTPVIPAELGEAVPERNAPAAAASPATVSAPELPSSLTAAATGRPGSSHNTMLSAFAPAVNQATAAAGAGDAGTAGAGGGPGDEDGASPAAPGEDQAIPVLLWDQSSPSGRGTSRPHDAASLARVDEDVAALWWS